MNITTTTTTTAKIAINSFKYHLLRRRRRRICLQLPAPCLLVVFFGVAIRRYFNSINRRNLPDQTGYSKRKSTVEERTFAWLSQKQAERKELQAWLHQQHSSPGRYSRLISCIVLIPTEQINTDVSKIFGLINNTEETNSQNATLSTDVADQGYIIYTS